jgi:hypothetical protein
MLYEQISYAEVTRKPYGLRHLLAEEAHPDIGLQTRLSKVQQTILPYQKKTAI